MKYLLDTSVFLWSLGASHKLNQRAKELFSEAGADLYLSAASTWEIAIKFALRTLKLPAVPRAFVPEVMRLWALHALEITHTHALAAGELPKHHRDPFDRMLIAQARSEGMVLLTADPIFSKYDVETLWCAQ